MNDNPEKKQIFGISGILADYISVSSEELGTVSPVMAEVLDWVVIERAEMLPKIELFCSENEIGQLQFVALDRPVSASKPVENLGVSLPNILKIEKPLQDGPLSFFRAFIYLKMTLTFGMNLEITGQMHPLKCFPHQEYVCQMLQLVWEQFNQDQLGFYSAKRK